MGTPTLNLRSALCTRKAKGCRRITQKPSAGIAKPQTRGDCVFCSGAQFNLGLMYANGEGVTQNYAEAARWYRKAADQGDAKAQVTVQVPQSIFLDKSRRIVYCMVDECESESPRKATWGSGEWPSALQPTQP